MSSESSTTASAATAHDAGHGALEHAGGHGEVEHRAVEHEQPSDWGWNGEWGKWASRGGWTIVVVLLLMFPGVTHYNKAGFLAQALIILSLVAILLWDRQRKRTSWRK